MVIAKVTQICSVSVMNVRNLAMSGVSVRPSLCPSHAVIESKPIAKGSCGFHFG